MNLKTHTASTLIVLSIIGLLPLSVALSEDDKKPAHQDKPKQQWIDLFNGKDLDGWKSTEFGGQGGVSVKNSQMIVEAGVDLSGVTWTKEDKLPKSNYEAVIEVQRVDGSDFFCGLTFPVKKDPCSLIVGGWGGGVCGLSSINGADASENATTSYMAFKSGQWYKIRLRVTDTRIEAWIDDKQIVDQNIVDRKIGIRIEVELSKPFGFATYQTTAAVRKLQIRKLTDEEIKVLDKEHEKKVKEEF